MEKRNKMCCHNCQFYSRMLNFCGCPESKACKNAEWVGASDSCVHWKERNEAGN